jgi:hypothetical protein
MAKRTYQVVDVDGAKALGLNPTHDTYHKFALVATIENTLDTFVCWGYKRETLQVEADKRNGAMEGVQTHFAKTMTKLDDEDAKDVPTDEAPKKRGRKPKNANAVPSEDALDDAIPLDAVGDLL